MTGKNAGTAPFRPRARLIRLLGDGLISDEVMAVVELVKNAYDADAREVIVKLDWSAEKTTAAIEIQDDGEGMDLETLLHAWLEPATDRKRRRQRKGRTALGRYPLGEKGVGRFAADKLGADLELVTRTPGALQEICLHVCWDQFDADGYLDEVENRWEVRNPMVFCGLTHGTRLRVTHLRSLWDSKKVTRVRDGLARLVSPFSTRADFRITLECPAFPDHAGAITTDLLGHAPYSLMGSVDSKGVLHIEGHPDTAVDLRQATSEHFLQEKGVQPPTCGPFRIALFVWDLDLTGLRRAAMDRAMREALKRLCGVSIYRDGFRVWPYGAPGDDWLELNQRRVNNPTMRVSTNQIVGVVEITQECNPDLQDRTSREGLIDAPALHDLKALVLGAIAWLEERRFTTRQASEQEEPDIQETDPVLQMIRQLHDRSSAGEAITRQLDRITMVYRQQLERSRVREERLMRLASTGLMSGCLGLEIHRTVSTATTALRIARNVVRQEAVSDRLVQCLEQVGIHVSLLGEQLDGMAPLYTDNSAGGTERLDVRSVVQHVATIFTCSLWQAGARFSLRAPVPLTVRMARAHLLQILIGLFDNALYWLKLRPQDRPPEICVQLLPGQQGLLFADSGPGVRAEVSDHIFQPFFTGRSNGRGLGLYIVQSILTNYGFSIELLPKPELLPGANFRIHFYKSPEK